MEANAEPARGSVRAEEEEAGPAPTGKNMEEGEGGVSLGVLRPASPLRLRDSNKKLNPSEPRNTRSPD